MAFNHYSVLLSETIAELNIKPEGIYVDGTLGGGGHAFEVCKALTTGHFYGIDQDDAAIAAAGERLSCFGEKVTILRNNYCNAKAALAEQGVFGVDGVVLDLGVSSYQLDTEDRGFSYRFDAPLDMRMDRRQTLTARDIVNNYSETELFHIIRDYGEDQFAKNIAKYIVKARADKPRRQTLTARDIVNNYSETELFHIIRDYGEDQFAKNIAKYIVKARADKPIETTFELNEIIKAAIPAKMRQNGHPSKQTFQAIRIECNRELEVLRNSLDDFIELLNPGGRLCIITFHSLEDRIVKTACKKNENPCTCPPEFPVCVCGKESKGKVITRKPVLPGKQELEENSRSKSAKLRVFEKKK